MNTQTSHKFHYVLQSDLYFESKNQELYQKCEFIMDELNRMCEKVFEKREKPKLSSKEIAKLKLISQLDKVDNEMRILSGIIEAKKRELKRLMRGYY